MKRGRDTAFEHKAQEKSELRGSESCLRLVGWRRLLQNQQPPTTDRLDARRTLRGKVPATD